VASSTFSKSTTFLDSTKKLPAVFQASASFNIQFEFEFHQLRAIKSATLLHRDKTYHYFLYHKFLQEFFTLEYSYNFLCCVAKLNIFSGPSPERQSAKQYESHFVLSLDKFICTEIFLLGITIQFSHHVSLGKIVPFVLLNILIRTTNIVKLSDRSRDVCLHVLHEMENLNCDQCSVSDTSRKRTRIVVFSVEFTL
jgi:hypothetical protein